MLHVCTLEVSRVSIHICMCQMYDIVRPRSARTWSQAPGPTIWLRRGVFVSFPTESEAGKCRKQLSLVLVDFDFLDVPWFVLSSVKEKIHRLGNLIRLSFWMSLLNLQDYPEKIQKLTTGFIAEHIPRVRVSDMSISSILKYKSWKHRVNISSSHVLPLLVCWFPSGPPTWFKKWPAGDKPRYCRYWGPN